MSKYSNLYDIDGNIINKSPQHTFTLEETEKLVDDLSKKVEENPDNEVYKVYLANAQKWLFKLYNEMNRDELMKRMNFVTDSIQNAKTEVNEAEQAQLDEISNAVEKLKEEYDRLEGGGTVLDSEVEQPVAVDKPVVMDEYVEPVEEINQ
jgi:hypothetical protein